MKKMLVVAVLLMLLLPGCGQTESTEEKVESADPEVEELVAGEVIKVSFIKLFEEPSVPGACYLQLLVENKSDQAITVYLTDVYVDGTSIMASSGVPMEIEPEKKSQSPFILFNQKLDDIGTLEFKICAYDGGMSVLEETETIEIENK